MSKYRGSLQEKIASALGRRKIDFKYETYHLDYTVSKRFRPEFIIEREDGSKFFVMCFQTMTDADRLELMHIVKQYEVDIKIIFTNACAQIPGTKMSYAEWADSLGIDWYMAHTISSIGDALKAWNNE